MVIIQDKSKRKITGGRYKGTDPKRMAMKGNVPTQTKLGEVKRKVVKARGRNLKSKLASSNIANVYDKNANKFYRTKIKNISESPSNRHYVRRNIVTKGAVIETEKGKARVTSRPGQDGVINAVLI